jgi:hypothetical protein
MEWVFLVFAWFFLAIVVGVAANTRGRDRANWIFLAIVISPLLAGLLLLALPNIAKGFEPQGVLAGTPYRVGEDGTVVAMLQGVLVRFKNMDQFRAAIEGKDDVPVKPVRPSSVTEQASQSSSVWMGTASRTETTIGTLIIVGIVLLVLLFRYFGNASNPA